jgi:SAM-dependent methyltransferase
MFSSLGGNDEQRIAAVARFTEPRSWLDVGTGHGHFCARARLRWPDARVDGCDMSESVEEAQRRGWIGTAYRGVFVDIAADIPHRYDVVSMHHYLEHTREPRRELGAAIGVLAPGGHLEIEVPDAECPWGRRLGRLWYQWAQPQHQHFVTCDNLVTELRHRGLEVLSVERGPATLSGDLMASVVLAMQSVSRSPHLPWLPPLSRAQRIWRGMVVTVGMPLLIAALVADRIKDARPDAEGIGNAYRVVARKPGGDPARPHDPSGITDR